LRRILGRILRLRLVLGLRLVLRLRLRLILRLRLRLGDPYTALGAYLRSDVHLISAMLAEYGRATAGTTFLAYPYAAFGADLSSDIDLISTAATILQLIVHKMNLWK